MKSSSGFSVNVFCSYSHKDSQQRVRMEKALTLLRRQCRIDDFWSDQRIRAGQNISKTIEEQIKKTDIFVMLLSHDYIASAACMEEFRLSGEVSSMIHFPVILSDCSWKDIENLPQIKAVPKDAKPIKSFRNRDEAWQMVYKEFKTVVEHLRKRFTVKDSFLDEIDKTEFLSQDSLNFRQIFVFPRLSSYTTTGVGNSKEHIIDNKDELMDIQLSLIHGEELSGKTALCRHLFLSLVEDKQPVIYVDLNEVTHKATPDVFLAAYMREFHGDYALWKNQLGKTIILDNLSPKGIEHVTLAVEHFRRVIVTLSTDTFLAYYKDDDRLAKFEDIKILSLTHSKQEELIRKRASLLVGNKDILDGKIDEIENRVNEVIINNKILPRYPFYVLSILQTYEGFMPGNISITSYGHCYFILIISYLLKSGVSNADDQINSCMNFLEHLAFKIYDCESNGDSVEGDFFSEFVREYNEQFLIRTSVLSRLSGKEYGVITHAGQFKNAYMYYYFLGKYLAKQNRENKEIISRMLERNHVSANCLTIIFMIHHTTDEGIIDDIVLRTMCALEDIEPSTLDRKEVRVFQDIVGKLPADLLSSDTIASERKKERSDRDRQEELSTAREMEKTSDSEPIGVVNDIYRILKNNEILGQVLRNKYGSLRRDRISEIIATIGDGGLRLVRLLLSGDEINDYANYVHKKYPEWDINKLKRAIRGLSFLWTMGNVERIVWALNKPEILPLVEGIVRERDTPAYELIQYFLRLDTIVEFSHEEKEMLEELWNKHAYPFFRKVVSVRTQHYLNTHHVQREVEQGVCSLLRVKYKPKVKRLS